MLINVVASVGQLVNYCHVRIEKRDVDKVARTKEVDEIFISLD
jgi:hypothetical protein